MTVRISRLQNFLTLILKARHITAEYLREAEDLQKLWRRDLKNTEEPILS